MTRDGGLDRVLPRFFPFLNALIDPAKRKDRTKKIVESLSLLVDRTESADLCHVTEHVMFPFEMYLERPWGSENVTADVLGFVGRFHARVEVDRVEFVVRTVDRVLR